MKLPKELKKKKLDYKKGLFLDKNELKDLFGENYDDFIKILRKDAKDAGINFREEF